MIFTYAPTYINICDVMNIAFQLCECDLYKDVLAGSWDFCYERNYWLGVDKSLERKKFFLSVKGYRNYLQLMNSVGWSIKKVNGVHKIDGCFICQILNVEDVKREIDKNVSYMDYFIYDSMKGVYSIASIEGRKISQGNMVLDKARNVCNMEMETLYFLEKQIKKKDNKQRTNIIKEWYANMSCSLVEVKNEMRIYGGLSGMKKFYQDLNLFAQHGHDEWMYQWSKYIQKQLKVIAKIRIENVHKIINDKNIYENALKDIQCWQEYFLFTNETYDMKQLKRIMGEIISLEEKVYDSMAIF